MESSLDLFALGVITCGIAAGAFVKGLTGLGLPLVAIPFMAGFLGAEHSVVVMQIPGLVSNAWLLWNTRRAASETALRYEMLVPALVTIFFGVWFLDSTDNRTVILLLAGVVAVFLVLMAFNPSFRLSGARGGRSRPRRACAAVSPRARPACLRRCSRPWSSRSA